MERDHNKLWQGEGWASVDHQPHNHPIACGLEPQANHEGFQIPGKSLGFGDPCLPVVSLPWVVLGMQLECGSGRQLCFFVSVKLSSMAGMGSGGHCELPH